MIFTIQLCLILLSCYIFWCEWDTTFSENLPSHILRISLCVICWIGIYKVDELLVFSEEVQFAVMTGVIFISFVTAKFIIKKYEINRMKYELRRNK